MIGFNAMPIKLLLCLKFGKIGSCISLGKLLATLAKYVPNWVFNFADARDLVDDYQKKKIKPGLVLEFFLQLSYVS